MQVLFSFIEKIADDPHLSTVHISLYLALWKLWKDSGCMQPLVFSRTVLKDQSKISSSNTFYNALKTLNDKRYILYIPSFDHLKGSQVFFNR